jgi:hypothetical protein
MTRTKENIILSLLLVNSMMAYYKLPLCALRIRTSKQVLKHVVIVLVIVFVRIAQALNHVC